MTRLSRFERKIMAAILAVAIVPLAGALLLGRSALQEAYEVGVNPRVRGELQRSLSLYQSYIALLRQQAEAEADAVAADRELNEASRLNDRARVQQRLDALVAKGGPLIKASLLTPQGAPMGLADGSGKVQLDHLRLRQLRRPLGVGGATVELTVVAPAQVFEDYQSAGELVEVFNRLQSNAGVVTSFYLLVYIGFLLSVITLAVALGMVMSRRVTRRIGLLVDATARVGAGDSEAQVPVGGNDEIGELSEAFNTMVRDLRLSRGRIEYLQRISAWQQFARRLAHEIKNPLTPIQLAVQQVHEGYKGPDQAHRHQLAEARGIVQEEVATLRRLVGEFSDFAKLPEASLAPADLNDFTRDAARSLGRLPEQMSGKRRLVTVHCQPSAVVVPVRIDPMLLKRCLDNLVRNSIHAIGDCGKGSRVLVRTAVAPGAALLEVHDDGPGIAAEARGRVFDPYVTTKADGTGLGLPIVKKIVLEHNGEVQCIDSHLGGICFRIRLPLETLGTSTRYRRPIDVVEHS